MALGDLFYTEIRKIALVHSKLSTSGKSAAYKW